MYPEAGEVPDVPERIGEVGGVAWVYRSRQLRVGRDQQVVEQEGGICIPIDIHPFEARQRNQPSSLCAKGKEEGC